MQSQLANLHQKPVAAEAGHSSESAGANAAPASTTFALPARCTLVQAEAIHRDCRAAFHGGSAAFRIDASAVEETDVSLLQIIIASQKSCRAAGRDFALTLSPAVAEAARRAGLRADPGGLSAAADRA
ncbi:STAS domain-containing protein [Paracoccus tibetensis]|uniref:STAS domain-containing protein n=1 Tax=Paracoccus tibetensis TaxID=336292 RepID=A0A1G5FHI4_9RHOB|nr:STAS domain-containing protein [Paracoccus tibetensis]SCY38729.1 STAS domain-containing protein [Paracoccus tibetensis]